MKSSSNILSKAEVFVRNLLETGLPSEITYHNLSHTLHVVAATGELTGGNGLNEEESEIVLLAAWLHDSGYVDGCENHEANSVKHAAQFFEENSFPEEKMEQVYGCIRATKMPQQPTNLLEQVTDKHFGL